MHRFTALYVALDATNSTNAKVRALVAYFKMASAQDAAWATYFLTGRRLRRVLRSADLRQAALRASALPEWLFDASCAAVGDTAEAVALLVPGGSTANVDSLAAWVEQRIAPLVNLPAAEVQERLLQAWQDLDRDGRLVFGKLLTGAFRVGVGRELVHRALSQALGVPVGDIAQRLTGPWEPSEHFWDELGGARSSDVPIHRPYPFCLAHALEQAPEDLGAPEAWQLEWKWDGVRVQLVVRDGDITLWSRGEDLVSDQFPEIVEAARGLAPGTVLDGEVVAWRESEQAPAPFSLLQRRLGRKAPGPRTLREVPLRMLTYDLLEREGTDIRGQPLHQRRAALEAIVAAISPGCIGVSPTLPLLEWGDVHARRARAREHAAEGLMLKRRDSGYVAGRTRGTWWKWKIEPFTIDAVLLYAQPGSGRRASLYTDYTFGVWHDGALVPFAKAYSGLTDQELREMDNWIRGHTIERFGPVRSVAPMQVFELAFEGIALSKRHKSGIAVRFPRIARWRKDKPATEADTLATLRGLAASAA